MEEKYFSEKLAIKTRKIDLERDFEGTSPPAVFIGSKLEHPKVNMGVLSAPFINTNSWIYNAPNFWSKKRIGVDKIIDLRKSLINSRIKTSVKAATIDKSKIIRQIQEIGMASIQADIELRLEKKPSGSMTYDKEHLPIAKSAKLKEIKITSNTRIMPEVEKVNNELELKSTEAIKYLYKKGLNEHSLTQIISIGVTGRKKDRKLLPTKNSITTIDDTLGKQLLESVRQRPIIDKPKYYFGGHYGNYYIIIMIPEIFHYELFEMGVEEGKITTVSTDYEDYNGRKEYAKETAGGYYAARLAIIEKLHADKKQAAVLALRFTTQDYHTPLGVWVCRNSTRIALEEEAIEQETKEEVMKKAKNLAKEKFYVDLEPIIQKSMMLKELKEQTKLKKYF